MRDLTRFCVFVVQSYTVSRPKTAYSLLLVVLVASGILQALIDKTALFEQKKTSVKDNTATKRQAGSCQQAVAIGKQA